VKQAYSIRSSYLHAGRRMSSRAFFGRSIPQLDPGAPNGILATVSAFPLRNLREYTSYCLRRCLTAAPPSQLEQCIAGEIDEVDFGKA
jgi:hypothetical protein